MTRVGWYAFMRGICISCALFDAYAVVKRPQLSEKLVDFVLLIIMTTCALIYTARIRSSKPGFGLKK